MLLDVCASNKFIPSLKKHFNADDAEGNKSNTLKIAKAKQENVMKKSTFWKVYQQFCLAIKTRAGDLCSLMFHKLGFAFFTMCVYMLSYPFLH